MKGNFTRFTFDPNKCYSGVRMQQGRVQLDADWNEQLDIQRHRDRVTRRDLIGRAGVPSTLARSFQIHPAPGEDGELVLGGGRCYVGGLLCEGAGVRSLSSQLDAAAAAGAGVYLAYLEAWDRHLTPLEDPALLEVALGGADTGTRTKVEWQVRLARLGDARPLSGAPFDWLPVAPSTGKLCAQIREGGAPTFDNQLYRVEIHTGGEVSNNAEDDGHGVTFKWSRENAAAVAKVVGIGFDGERDKTTITIEPSKAARGQGFAAEQWVELTSERRILAGEPGVLLELVAVGSGQQLEADGSLDTHDWSEADAGSPATIRRWDRVGSSAEPALESGKALHLGDGVEIEFGAGSYRSGDYWLIPVRTLLADVLWTPGEFHEPHGQAHHHCPLALLEFAEEDGAQRWSVLEDLRPTFAPPTHAATRPLKLEPGSEGVDDCLVHDDGWLLTASGDGGGKLQVQQVKEQTQQSVMTIDEDGRVGIGTEEPAARLHVAGDLNATKLVVAGSLDVGGSEVIDSQGKWVGSLLHLAHLREVCEQTENQQHSIEERLSVVEQRLAAGAPTSGYNNIPFGVVAHVDSGLPNHNGTPTAKFYGSSGGGPLGTWLISFNTRDNAAPRYSVALLMVSRGYQQTVSASLVLLGGDKVDMINRSSGNILDVVVKGPTAVGGKGVHYSISVVALNSGASVYTKAGLGLDTGSP